MKYSEMKRSKILILCKFISLVLIFLSISEFYFERTSVLEQAKQWRVDLIEKGENVYREKKTVWNELSEDKKEASRIIIKRCENRIKYNIYLIFMHVYNLIFNIVLFVSLFILNRWVKWYLIFWTFSDILISACPKKG